jgi:hypothetical protein
MADVAVPTALPLSTVPDVELMRTGTWQLSTGPATFTTGDLVSAVAALECPAVRRPILKLGHTDPRFDGQPAIGYVNNMATAAGASVLRGDYVGMPGWLTVDVLASAYPDRSIEGWWNYQCAVGHVHPFVVTGVALLGVSPPGIGVLESLQDVATLYGVAAASGAGGTPFAVRAGDFETLHPRGEHGHFRTKVSSEVAKLEAGIVNITGYDDDTIDVDFAVDGDQVVTTLTSDAAHSLNLAVSIFAEEDDGWTTQIPNGDRMIVVTRESDTNAIIDFGDGSGIEISPGDGEKLGQKLDDVSSDVQQHMESVIPEDSYAEIGGYTHILGYPDGTLGLLGYSDSDPNGDSTGERRLSQPDALKLANALIKVNKAPAASTGTTVQLSDGPIEIHKSLNGDLRIDLDPGNSTDTALSDQVVDIEGTYATSTLSHLLNFAKTGRDVLASRSAMPNPNPTPVAAGVSVEDLRRAYYDGPGGSDWDSWISEIQLDPLQLIVSSDDGYQLVPVTVNGDSTITFGPPVPVEMTYTPKPAGDGSTTVAASRLVYASRAESRPRVARRPRATTQPPATEPEPTATEGGAPVALDLDGLRSRLGLTADADEAAINEALLQRLDAPPAPAPVPAAASALPPGVVTIDQSTLDELRGQAAQGVQARAQQIIERRDNVIEQAVRAGKITPARREHWQKAWAADAEGAEQALASLAPGLVPVDGLTGVAGGDDNANSDDAVYAALFGKEG